MINSPAMTATVPVLNLLDAQRYQFHEQAQKLLQNLLLRENAQTEL